MKLALFDLDHTLLTGDSDVLWTEFLIDKGILSEGDRERSDQFFQDYEAGRLDIDAFLQFQLRPLREHDSETLLKWRSGYVREKILPAIPEASRRLVRRHRQSDHRTVIITATNRFTTTPIADELEVDALLATELEEVDGRYTGRPQGPPCFRGGKITCLRRWLADQESSLEESWFYSDSVNDLPLLEWVDHPVVVNPDPRLTQIAARRGWPLLDLH